MSAIAYGSGLYGADTYTVFVLGTLLVEYSTDDASDPSPTWISVDEQTVRSFSISRGRESELADVDAGSAVLTLDNRDREFDSTFSSLIRPMNRWRIRVSTSGGTYSLFTGYAESYDQQWPAGFDAVTVVSCVDEFKVLALDRLPNTDPPRDTYAEVVAYDQPQGYWRMQPVNYESVAMVRAEIGDTHLGFPAGGGTTLFVTSPIVGDASVNQPSTAPGVGLARSTTTGFTTMSGESPSDFDSLNAGGPGDAASLLPFTFEMWWKTTEATPAATRAIATGPLSGGNPQWGLYQNVSGTIAGFARNSGGTLYTGVGQTFSVTADEWIHIALAVTSANVGVYINGVLDSAGSFSGTPGVMDAGSYMLLGATTAVGGTRSYDEVAFYRREIGIARIQAHYTAGINRGYPAQDPGARITAVLADSQSIAPTSIRAGSREMHPEFMAGRDVLSTIRRAEEADNVDAVLFVAADGTITFLDDGHRSVAPWNTVQATFDDDGTDLPYLDVNIDYSESFLYNEVNATRNQGTTTTSSDATSISRYFKRGLSLTDLPLTTDADVSAIATALLAKYKDPMTRIVSLTLDTSVPAVTEAVLPLDIGARIRLLRTPPGGGARIDQTLFVQKIQIDAANDGAPWRIQLGVSPL